MNKSLIWRGILLVAVTALAIWLAYPPEEKINLGLDLKGGMHLVLQVKTEDALRAETDKNMDQLRRELETKGVGGVAVKRLSDTSFELTGTDQEDVVRTATNDLFRRGVGQSDRWTFTRSGDRFVFTMGTPNQNEIRDQAARQAEQTIDNRVNAFGVTENVITRAGGDRIVVQLPGVDDPERVRKLIKSTAFLEFRLVDARSGGRTTATPEEMAAVYGGKVPDNIEVMPQDVRDPSGRVLRQVYWGVERQRVVTGRDLKDARAGVNEFQQPVVLFDLTPDGGRVFGKVTGENIGRQLAVILDGKVQTAPVLQDRITDSGQIKGNYTQEEAQDLVTTLRSGALPAGIEYLEERTVGASLGADSIRQGVRASLIGGALVVLLMLVVYRLSGLNAIVTLVLNGILIFGALAYLHSTLTLPGIAGLVLTIGMAVDANVLVYERIREELDNGRTVRSAIDIGFHKAFATIIDTHMTTMISSLFLFQFGTGPVRGFAITLIIGVFGTIFTAVFASRWLFDLTRARAGKEKLSI